MEEDRVRYEERHVAPTAVEAALQEAEAASTAQAQSSAGTTVRLQIRCATSGRTVTSTSFSPEDTLRAVREFAAKELGLLPGDDENGPQLSLSFPPRTTFSASQMSSSLSALGLAPSATLLVKGIADTQPDAAEDEAAAEEPRANEGEPGPPCPRGHAMATLQMTDEMWCDKCGQGLAVGAAAFTCKDCDYIECCACSGRA